MDAPPDCSSGRLLGPEVSNGVTRASLLGWLEVGNSLGQYSILQALRVEAHHVWFMVVSCTSQLPRENSLTQCWEQKKHCVFISRTLDDHLLNSLRILDQVFLFFREGWLNNPNQEAQDRFNG